MSGLPRGWAVAEIGAICDLINGRAFKPTDWSTSGVPIVRIQNLNNPDAPFNYCDFEVDPRVEIDSGELLFAWSGTPGTSFGAHVWQGGRAVLNQHIFRVLFNPQAVERDFLKLAINVKLEELIGKAHGGVGLRHVTKGKFEETKVSVPPLPEQRRIVAKLDALDASSKRARADLDRIPALVARAKQAFLAKAFETVPDTKRIGEFVSRIEAGKNLRCIERPPEAHERGVVKVSAVTWGEFDPSASKTLPDDFEPPEHTLIRPGDFLFSRANTLELVGACVIVVEAPSNLFLSDKILRLILPDDLKPWLKWFLRSPRGRAALEEASSGNQMSMRNIGQKALLDIPVPFASADIRKQIVHRIESAFTKIDRMAAEAASASRLLDRLDQALLAKAFRGELVPQDPEDEAAEKLLARITAARAAAPKTKRSRKTRG